MPKAWLSTSPHHRNSDDNRKQQQLEEDTTKTATATTRIRRRLKEGHEHNTSEEATTGRRRRPKTADSSNDEFNFTSVRNAENEKRQRQLPLTSFLTAVAANSSAVAPAATDHKDLKIILLGRCYEDSYRNPHHAPTVTDCASAVGALMGVLESKPDLEMQVGDFEAYVDALNLSSPRDKTLFFSQHCDCRGHVW